MTFPDYDAEQLRAALSELRRKSHSISFGGDDSRAESESSEKKITAIAEKIALHCKTLAQKNRALHENCSRLEYDNRDLHKQLAVVDKKNTDLSQVKQEVDSLRETLQRIRQDNTRLTDNNRILSKKVDELTAQLDSAQTFTAALLNSNSWKATKPLRAFTTMMRKIRAIPLQPNQASADAKEEGYAKPFVFRLGGHFRRSYPGIFHALRNNETIYKAYFRYTYGRWPGISDFRSAIDNSAPALPDVSWDQDRTQIIYNRLKDALSQRNEQFMFTISDTSERTTFIYKRLKAKCRQK